MEGKPDVYQYVDLPEPFRVQVVHIWKRAVGTFRPAFRILQHQTIWGEIHDDIAEAHGLFCLVARPHDDRGFESVVAYFMARHDTDLALDVIETVFGVVDGEVRAQCEFAAQTGSISQHPDEAIRDLNARFREHGIGYQYEGGHIVRVDSQYLHAAAVRPALALLTQPGFEGPEEEFQKAHEHFRHGRYKEANNEALKAFESTMKSICLARNWPFDAKRDTANALIKILVEKKLLPEFLDSAWSGLRSVLEGVPTSRNRTSGHGQGATPTKVPGHLAAYVLHVAAANIVLIVTAHLAMK